MMGTKILVFLCCVIAGVLAGEKYTSKYDNIDIKEIIENDRLLKGHVDCVMGRGKCTPEGKELRDNLQDALETGCEKCTDAQKDGATTMIDHLITKKIEIWNELCAKFDPTGKWRKVYEDQAKERGIVIPKN